MVKISIVIPVHNAERYLSDCLESVVAQTLEHFEICAVDDGSTDRSRAILEHWARRDPRIRYDCLPQRSGAAAARNRGIDMASGDYIAFLDADDLWHPDKLKRQLAHMRDTDSGFSCTAYERMDEAGKYRGMRRVPPHVDYNTLFLNNTIGTSTVMVRRDLLGPTRFPRLERRQDFALWLRLLKPGGVCTGFDEPLTRYRRHALSLSANRLRAALSTWRVYRTLPEISLRRALWSYGNYLFRTTRKHVLQAG
ncbi:glycosyltransferase family 2 protein [Celeribacter persicus]|uniref:Teichuronic acid biosynthesis glycosyltransferase TuaG n=1 Tax=Celeribacter persicus TaxID=1651082 RepID=A0A2T5HTU7_9RHOB|nr:glycosyltransferase family 2 protein [Celeribacter persicus]PTQ74991.1 teichuronic acid biosynthesis glycosyltransferase TuaG [Celeribacter persicus]